MHCTVLSMSVHVVVSGSFRKSENELSDMWSSSSIDCIRETGECPTFVTCLSIFTFPESVAVSRAGEPLKINRFLDIVGMGNCCWNRYLGPTWNMLFRNFSSAITTGEDPSPVMMGPSNAAAGRESLWSVTSIRIEELLASTSQLAIVVFIGLENGEKADMLKLVVVMADEEQLNATIVA